jgi:thiol-disulfide isomerase/thioredoxin
MTVRRITAGLVILGLFGCSESPSPPSAQPPATAKPADMPREPSSSTRDWPLAPPTTPQAQISLEVKSWDQTQQLVAAQKGKVVVVDMWSTWCEPCVREFPNLVKLHRAHPNAVVCLSFNLDYSGAAGETPESFREAVSEFLNKQGATLQNVISSDATDDVFQRLKLGSIPAVLVYGPDGRLAKRFDNDDGLYGEEGFTYEKQIVPLVEQLLAKAGDDRDGKGF